MKPSRIFPIVALLGCLVFSSNTFAVIIDVNAPVVQLRDPNNGGCTEAGGTVTLNNCFTAINALSDWIFKVRTPAPSSSAPLLVKIGPGNFGQTYCGVNPSSTFSNITYQGSGMGQTKIPSITIIACTDLFFSDITFTGVNGYGIALIPGGSNTTWTNVEVLGGSAWREFSCGSRRGKHYWFNSRIISTGLNGTSAYKTSCDESWFFGSEITAIASSTLTDGLSAIQASGLGEVHVYGGVIRALNTGNGIASGTSYAAISTSDGGIVHIHGTGIDVTSSSASPIVALAASNGGMIHANGAAYNMSTGAGGRVTRIAQDTNPATHVHAPYFWESHPTPQIPNIVNVNADGADMVVQSLCAPTGCQTAGTETHLLLYNSTCTGIGGPWFDVVTRSCR